MSLQEDYKKTIAPKLQKELALKNVNAVPVVEKVMVHVAIGSYLAGGKDYSEVVENIATITGQRPFVSKARKAVSNFKLRLGMPVGVSVTLRGKRMYHFLEKLVNVVFPRVRDFQGIPKKGFDGQGNYNIGLKEFTVFPDISLDDITKMHGVQITIKTTAKDNDSGFALLRELGFPFKKDIAKKSEKEPVA